MTRVKVLGSRGLIDEKDRLIRRHSGLLIDERILVDCGEKEFLGTKPDVCFLTHAHPDHWFPVKEKVEKVPLSVYCSGRTAQLLNTEIEQIRVFKRLSISRIRSPDYTVYTYPVVHSIKAPANGYVLSLGSSKIVIPGDVLSVKERIREKLWTDALVYVGDGSSIERELVRRKEGEIYGHASVMRQLGWCNQGKIEVAVLRHWGSETVKKGIRWARRRIEQLLDEKDWSYPSRVILATDGATLDIDSLQVKTPDVSPVEPKRFIKRVPRAGLYLTPPHGELIWERKKTLIVKSKKFEKYVGEPLYLLSDGKCYGILSLRSPYKIDRNEFEKLRDKHRISDEEVKKWGWKGTLWAYDFDLLRRFDPPLRVRIPRGVQVFVDSENIKFE